MSAGASRAEAPKPRRRMGRLRDRLRERLRRSYVMSRLQASTERQHRAPRWLRISWHISVKHLAAVRSCCCWMGTCCWTIKGRLSETLNAKAESRPWSPSDRNRSAISGRGKGDRFNIECPSGSTWNRLPGTGADRFGPYYVLPKLPMLLPTTHLLHRPSTIYHLLLTTHYLLLITYITYHLLLHSYSNYSLLPISYYSLNKHNN